VEFGPALHAKLGASTDDRRRLWLKLPLRTAISVGTSGIDHQGWVFAPYLEYEIEQYKHRRRRSELSISLGPQYADDRYHEYYYGVAPGFATADRAEYVADGGYSGSRLTLTWTRRHDKWWIGAFVRYDNLSGATFEDSPLVKDRDYLAVGIGLARILAQSDNKTSGAGKP
jgi:outer membrane protein